MRISRTIVTFSIVAFNNSELIKRSAKRNLDNIQNVKFDAVHKFPFKYEGENII